MPYRKLSPDAIVRTIDRLNTRVSERFPQRGLSEVATDLAAFAREETGRAQAIARPQLLLRVLVSLVVLAAAVSIVALGRTYGHVVDSGRGLTSFEGLEALINIVLLAGAGVFFLLNLETRSKRNAVLSRIDQMRSIAHVIDMHQLTKDPTVELHRGTATHSSPVRDLKGYELVRYLDYCAEMLALLGKLAAVYLEYIKDPVVLSAVNDFENLTSDLSRKIWQKISVLEPAAAEQASNGVSGDIKAEAEDPAQLQLDLPPFLR